MDAGEDMQWTDPDWVADTNAWIETSLRRIGMPLTGPIEQPRVRPWATVLRAPTRQGTVWCKGMVEPVAHEPVAVSILSRIAPARMPRLLAADAGRRLMLTADGGVRLRDLDDERRDPKRWVGMLRTYARLQRDVEHAADELVGAGVPDRRLAVLPGLVAGLVDELRPEGVDGLADRVGSACAELASLRIPETIEHGDLHDAQVLVGPDGDRVFDWGDASVAHPFMTLTVALRVFAETVGVPDEGPAVDAAIDAFLERWRSLATLAALRRGARLGRALGGASRALTWQAIAVAAPATEREFPGFAAEWLKDTARALA
jgi:hypothetical protein